MVSYFIGIFRTTFMEHIKLSRKGKPKYQVKSEVLLNETSLSFYLLGVFFTDGNINDRKHNISFSISSSDDLWLGKIRDILCPQKPIYIRKNNASLEMSNISCINWLIDWGCSPRKSLTAKILKEIPQEYIKDFIRGVIDGDGSISNSKYSKTKNNKTYTYYKKVIYICSASKEFITQIQSMIPEDIKCNIYNLGKKNSIINGREVKASSDIYRLVFNDSNAIKLANYCYYDGNELSLDRKQTIANLFSSASRI